MQEYTPKEGETLETVVYNMCAVAATTKEFVSATYKGHTFGVSPENDPDLMLMYLYNETEIGFNISEEESRAFYERKRTERLKEN